MRRPIRLLPAIGAALLSSGTLAQGADIQTISVDPVVVPDGGPNAPVLRVTYPATGTKLSLVILTHGNRLSRMDYQPLVTALARAGHVVIQPDHPDASADGFMPSTPQPEDAWRIRVEQVRWIADHASLIADRTQGLKGRMDAHRIAVVGHSFGGQTVALAVGAKVEGQAPLAPVAGIGASVMLSPPGDYDGLTPEWKARAAYLRTDWAPMHGPALVINGDRDMTPLTDQGPHWHDAPYVHARAGQDVCLMTVKDAGHYLGGIDSVLRPPAGDATPARRAAVLEAVVTFLGAKLDHRPADEARWAEERKGLACK